MNNYHRLFKATLLIVFFCSLARASVIHAVADGPGPNLLDDVAFEQRLNAQVPLEATFRDESGSPVRLGSYFGARPVIMQFAYFDCPMLCNLVYSDLVKNVRQLGLSIGDQYEILTVSINPEDTPQLASSKKAAILKDYDLSRAGSGWHFLTGDQQSIQELAQAAGFRYAYDAQIDQFAHPAGILVLTPQGRISRYFFGIDYSPTDLRLGLVEASARKIGTPVDQFFLLCYHYDPVTGKYTLLINNVIRLAGSATVLILLGVILVLFHRERKDTASQESH